MDESTASGGAIGVASGGASAGGRGKNKRFWTKEEDNALVAALSDLNADPHWKCENGFRNGYMVRLEEIISKAIPGCGLKALPHIDSRLKTLVTKFRAIVQMLGTSGFKWDDERQMISVERSVYDEYCKVHPNCKNLYGHAFPHLNALLEVYGKDYAIENLPRVLLKLLIIWRNHTVQVMLDSSDEEDAIVSGNAESTPPLKKVKREHTFKRKGGKKESGSSSNSELASLQGFMKDMNVHLSTMANVMSRADEREQRADEREREISEKSEKVLDVLLALEGITPQEALEVAPILTAQPNKLMIFFKCPDELKCVYVKSLLT
ncbi:uncharacterized protein LOC141605745 [Silene latifolia]|uniref:uncharacterized protein LOC141605745 n=1 Tax=Silene latifolia TaxID=37657 RepID=UPI003D77F8AC